MFLTSDSLLFKAGRVLFGGERPNWVKVSNRSTPEKYPHKRLMKYFDKQNTNTKSKSDKYKYRSSPEEYPHKRLHEIFCSLQQIMMTPIQIQNPNQTNTNPKYNSDKYKYRKKQ